MTDLTLPPLSITSPMHTSEVKQAVPTKNCAGAHAKLPRLIELQRASILSTKQRAHSMNCSTSASHLFEVKCSHYANRIYPQPSAINKCSTLGRKHIALSVPYTHYECFTVSLIHQVVFIVCLSVFLTHWWISSLSIAASALALSLSRATSEHTLDSCWYWCINVWS